MLSGRAGRLGLAISLVSQVEEKVWYCTKKGYKPWLKPTAQDVKSHGEEGHTIWYNEPQLLKVTGMACCYLLISSPKASINTDNHASILELTHSEIS